MIRYHPPTAKEKEARRGLYGHHDIRIPYIASTRVPTLQEVEAIRQKTESAFKLYKVNIAELNRSIDRIIDGTSFEKCYGRDASHRILNNNDTEICFLDNYGTEFRYPQSHVDSIWKDFDNLVGKLEYGDFRYRELVKAQSGRNFALHRLDCFIDILTTLSCRQLTGKVVTDLPREIRDLVYASILNKRDLRGRTARRFILYNGDNENGYTPLATSDPEFPPKVCRYGMLHPENLHCWSQESCGVAFVRELAEMSYQNSTFAFRRYSHLSRFLGLENPPTSNSALENDFLPWKYVTKLLFQVPHDSSGLGNAMENMPLLRKLGRKARIEFIFSIEDSVWGSPTDTVNKILEKYRTLFLLLDSVQKCGHQVLIHLDPTRRYRLNVWARKDTMAALPPPLPDMERLIEENLGVRLTLISPRLIDAIMFPSKGSR